MSDSAPRSFTDAELKAYLAGEAGDDLRARIDEALETDNTLAMRLAALDDLAPLIGPAFEAVLAQAPAAELQWRLKGLLTRRHPSWWASRRTAMAAMAASIAAAFGLGQYTARAPVAPPAPAPTPPPAPPTTPAPAAARPAWIEAVAAYVRLYSAETFKLANLSAANRMATLSALGEKTGQNLAPLATLPGLRFQRAEVLQLRGRPLGQIAYLDAQDQVVMVCILVRPTPPEGKAPPAAPIALKEETIDDLRVVHWDVQPLGYLVIGRTDVQALRGYASQVIAALSLK